MDLGSLAPTPAHLRAASLSVFLVERFVLFVALEYRLGVLSGAQLYLYSALSIAHDRVFRRIGERRTPILVVRVKEAGPIGAVYRIVRDVGVQIGLSAGKEDGILGRPPAGDRVVIAHTKPDKPSISVVNSARKAKGLEAWVGIPDDVAELIVVQALQNLPRSYVDDEPRAANMVGNDPVGRSSFND